MPGADAAAIVALVGLAAALLIVDHCVAALVALVRGRDPVRVRLPVIEGALWGLSLKSAASLLKIIEIQGA